jgi:2-oxoglutarate dehydrogenase E1 component
MLVSLRNKLMYGICLFFCCTDAEIVWCQEEPMNMGAYSYINPRLLTAMKALGRGGIEDIKYAGRAPSAATATGFYSVHVQEQTELVQKALQRDPIKCPF